MVRKPTASRAEYLRSFVGSLATEGRNTNSRKDQERRKDERIERRNCKCHPHDSPDRNDYRCCQGHKGVSEEDLDTIDVFRDSRQKVTGVCTFRHRRGLRLKRVEEVVTQQRKRTESNVVSRVLLKVAEQGLEQRHNHQRPDHP